MSFTKYNTEDSVISSEVVTRGLWSGDAYTLSTFFTGSGYTEYYLDIYDANLNTSPSASIQFDIQFGHASGSGSAPINTAVPGYSPSRVVYGQYRNLVYGTETQNFSFDNLSTTSDSIYVINISRARYKESLLPGSLKLALKGTATSSLFLTDDSGTTNLTRFLGENRYYNIISGSNGSYYTSGTPSVYYGLFFPDLNVIVLNANALTSSLGGGYFVTSSLGSSTAYNHRNLFDSINRGNTLETGSFNLKSSETISARYFFTRIKNSEYNYTTNPSIIDANGNLNYTSLINNPQTYITTVGMYNDNNELLAVAKLSKPLVKDFTKEALIRVKLDY
jgi:hypothetical protein